MWSSSYSCWCSIFQRWRSPKVNLLGYFSTIRCFSEIYALLCDIFKLNGKVNSESSSSSILARFQADSANNLSNGEVKIRDIYSSTMYGIAKVIGVRCHTGGKFKEDIQSIKPKLLKSISSISKKFITLETIPARWKELQFLHLSNFKKDICESCENTLCFSWYIVCFRLNSSF